MPAPEKTATGQKLSDCASRPLPRSGEPANSRQSFTPGPWRAFKTRDGLKVIGIGELTGDGIADGGFGLWRDGPEALANAHLIAAAPELHAALIEVVDLYCDTVNSGDCGFWDPEKMDEIKHARAALKRARGE
jgi:hypothetical protein